MHCGNLIRVGEKKICCWKHPAQGVRSAAPTPHSPTRKRPKKEFVVAVATPSGVAKQLLVGLG